MTIYFFKKKLPKSFSPLYTINFPINLCCISLQFNNYKQIQLHFPNKLFWFDIFSLGKPKKRSKISSNSIQSLLPEIMEGKKKILIFLNLQFSFFLLYSLEMIWKPCLKVYNTSMKSNHPFPFFFSLYKIQGNWTRLQEKFTVWRENNGHTNAIVQGEKKLNNLMGTILTVNGLSSLIRFLSRSELCRRCFLTSD